MIECDYLIIGGGDTGIYLAENLNKLSKSIVLVESYKLGGGSLNNIIIPKKEFYKQVKSFSYVLKYFTDQEDLSNALYETRRVIAIKIKQNINKQLTKVFTKVAKLENLKILFGVASFLTKNTARVLIKDKYITIKYKKCLLCIGKDFVEPQIIKGANNVLFLTKYNIFHLGHIPLHLGIIGLTLESIEVASFYSHLGVKVSIFEEKLKSQVLPLIDRTMASFLVNKLIFSYVDIHFDTQIKSIEENNGEILLYSQNQDIFKTSDIYLHTKERFDLEEINGKSIGLKSTYNGINISSDNKTNIKNIYAFGSCTNKNESKKIVRAKIESFINLVEKLHKIKYKTLTSQLMLNTVNFITYKPQQEHIGKIISFEMEYFLDSIGVGLSEYKAVGQYGPKIKVLLISNKKQSEFLKLIYFVSSKRLIGYWATSYFKIRFHSLLSFAMVSKSNTLTIIDIIQSHVSNLEKKIH
ncbi:MAG: NAD(P)/FAD-dependent oxidoreductase [candidate division SR1 bacterium]|nr:NAD(P)/FAD-dependent oxidoreductase [candidate division SR1 bacterium]